MPIDLVFPVSFNTNNIYVMLLRKALFLQASWGICGRPGRAACKIRGLDLLLIVKCFEVIAHAAQEGPSQETIHYAVVIRQ